MFGTIGACEHARRLDGIARASRTLRSPPPDLLLVVLTAAVGAPLLVRGPGIVLDDWFTLMWARFLGTWDAAGPTQPRARPLGALVYDLQYGVIGARPAVWIACQLAITAGSACLFHRLLRRFIPTPVATSAAAVWVLSANHATLDSWGAGSLAAIALLLLLAGAVLLPRANARPLLETAAVALCTASPLVYEATLPAAGLVCLALPWLHGQRPPLARAFLRAVPVGLAGLWLVTGSHHLRRDQGWFDLASTADSLFGQGVGRWTLPSSVLLIGGMTASLLAAAAPWLAPARRLLPQRPGRLLLAGLGVAAVGYLPFVRYPITALGIGDRSNVVAGLGGAMAWTAVGWAIARRRAVLVPVAGSFILLLGAARVARANDWADAGDDSRAILDIVIPRLAAAPPGTVLVAGPPPAGHEGVHGLLGTIEPAVQYLTGDQRVRATVAITEAEWAATPPERRIDISAVGA